MGSGIVVFEYRNVFIAFFYSACMGEFLEHNCGLVVAHTLHDAYAMIQDLQHRGRDAAGIAAIGDRKIDVMKWIGPVKAVALSSLEDIFPSSNYHTYMAHVRYKTKGSEMNLLASAHPQTIGGIEEYYGSHVIIRDCDFAAVHNGQVEEKYFSSIDKSTLRTTCDTEALLHYFAQQGEFHFLNTIPGSYTIAIAQKERAGVMVLRDRTGIKPGVLGEKDGKVVIASEDIALRKNGAVLKRNLVPGSVYYLTPTGVAQRRQVVEPALSYCFFEHNYLGHRDSITNGVSINELRMILGEIAAEECCPAGIDVVTWVPNCPEAAADVFAEKIGKSATSVFYKLDEVRSFMEPSQEKRDLAIEENLFLLPRMRERLKGKRVVVIDDSTVRGTVIKRVQQLLYHEVGVAEAFVINYTPPIGIVGVDGIARGCMFGVNMPADKTNFIARGKTIEQISSEVGIQVRYISLEGMLKGFQRAGIPPQHLCTYCIGGKHPFER